MTLTDGSIDMEKKLPKAVLFFDGVCNFCDASVQWILTKERNQILHFSALQSDYARAHLPMRIVSQPVPQSLVFQQGDLLLEGSDAALKVALNLRAPWSWLYVLRFVPKSLRDAVYFWIARNRYRWFGKRDACMIPDAALRNRFLD